MYYGWREHYTFSCENCGEDVHAVGKEDVDCPHCGHVSLYEPTDAEMEDARRYFWREP